MSKRPITTPAQLRASVMGFNGTKDACYDSPFAFYMSYLETKKRTGDYTAMKLAKDNRAWILRQAEKLTKTHERKNILLKTIPPTQPQPNSTKKESARQVPAPSPTSDLWRTAYDIPLAYSLDRDD